MMDTALLFNGGKDSLTCLYLNRYRWDDIYVVWMDAGATYPDMMEYMEGWKAKLPNFIHLKSNQPDSLAKHGWPVDVVPVENTELGKIITGNTGPLMRSYLECCAENVWVPLHLGLVNLGVKKAIKGQRIKDRRKSTARDGTVFDGVEYIMPIQDWSEYEVFEYLKSVGAELAPGYKMGEKTGRDCWDCTAYLDDNRERIHNLPHEQREEVMRRINIINDAVDQQKVVV
jgi:phosphoadenosine phosphosulfate reductase